ncbi:MAG: exodeoxyribonuclease VII large subunit [Clostridia bacterium]|nr:exodeoxyribonuclease VII large subunit [Clostridia bacterium]
MENNQVVLKVSQVAEYIRLSLTQDPLLSRIRVQGEISNLRRYTSGHMYFTLKDEDAVLRCVMFRSYVNQLRDIPKDGENVIIKGSVSFYTKDGQLQIYCEDMKRQGVGDLYRRFEMLRDRLRAEGLFDQERKRAIPLFPRRIGVVTSPSGAVIRDIIQVASRRNPKVDILLCPSLVQGEGAAQTIAEGIRRLSSIEGVDVIIIGRGGGSLEDLWPFNEEIVAYAVAACPVPVVSAVGHETDFSISDFAADLRAPTPSAAAELVVPLIEQYRTDFAGYAADLNRAMERTLERKKQDVLYLEQKLEIREPSKMLENNRIRLRNIQGRLASAMEAKRKEYRSQRDLLSSRLEALGPMKVLERGYSLVQDKDHHVLKAGDLSLKQPISIRFWDGTAQAEVTEVKLHAEEGKL